MKHKIFLLLLPLIFIASCKDMSKDYVKENLLTKIKNKRIDVVDSSFNFIPGSFTKDKYDKSEFYKGHFKFKVKLKNTSNDIINKFYLNIIFGKELTINYSYKDNTSSYILGRYFSAKDVVINPKEKDWKPGEERVLEGGFPIQLSSTINKEYYKFENCLFGFEAVTTIPLDEYGDELKQEIIFDLTEKFLKFYDKNIKPTSFN